MSKYIMDTKNNIIKTLRNSHKINTGYKNVRCKNIKYKI